MKERSEAQTAPHGFALVAPPRRGKTRALGALGARLRAHGVTVAGVTQPASPPRGRVQRYDVESLATGERRRLAERRSDGVADGVADGVGFSFRAAAFAWAARELQRPGPVLLLDELGWLEADGQGHLPGLWRALAAPGRRALVLGVREDVFAALSARLAPPLRSLVRWTLPADVGAGLQRAWLENRVATLMEVL
jgi:nucleoside-triphosphatase THEP1